MSAKREKEKQPIQVFVRTRPLNLQERSSRSLTCIDTVGNREISIRQAHGKRYTFDKVFGPNVKQLEVYIAVVSPFIHEVLAGYNCTVFAYGQTGTGKTYTMAGGSGTDASISWQNDESAGIIPRAMSHLFEELMLLQQEYTVRVSYLELYNEEIFDLLSDTDDPARIKLFEDQHQKGSVIIQGLEQVTVAKKNQVYKILEKGQEKRRTACTLMNTQSSRSHTVFSITIHTRETTVDGEMVVKTGKLNLVDLAGSENISRSGAVDKRAREAGSINQSLLTLGRVIKALVERTGHVPYRESKLTRILQDSLGGRTKTSIIATISPAACSLEETLSTLDYANRARNITNRPEVNQRMSQKALMNQYSEEIEKLRKDLAATRSGTGICLAQENYEQLVADNRYAKEELAEKITSIRDLETQIKLLEDQRIDDMQQWEKLNEAFAESQRERKMQKYLATNYEERAHKYYDQAQTLLNITQENTENCKKMNYRISEKCFELMRTVRSYKSNVQISSDELKTIVERLQINQDRQNQIRNVFVTDLLGEIKNFFNSLGNSVDQNKRNVKNWLNELENSYKSQIEEFDKNWSNKNQDLYENASTILDDLNSKHEDATKALSQKLNDLESFSQDSFESVIKRINDSNDKFLSQLEELSKNVLQQNNLSAVQHQNIQKSKKNLSVIQEALNALNGDISSMNETISKSNDLTNCNVKTITKFNSDLQLNSSEISTDIDNSVKHIEKECCNIKMLSEQLEGCRDQFKEAYLQLLSDCDESKSQATTFLKETLTHRIDVLNKDFLDNYEESCKKTDSLLKDNNTKTTQTVDQYAVSSQNSSSELLSEVNLILQKASSLEENVIEAEDSLIQGLIECQEKLANFTGISKENSNHFNTPTKLKTIYPEINKMTPKERILTRYRADYQKMANNEEDKENLQIELNNTAKGDALN